MALTAVIPPPLMGARLSSVYLPSFPFWSQLRADVLTVQWNFWFSSFSDALEYHFVVYFLIIHCCASAFVIMSKHFRVCSTENCKIRLPDIVYDGHSRCSTCIGKVCNLNDHCFECAGWSNEMFDKYVKHRHMLVDKGKKS